MKKFSDLSIKFKILLLVLAVSIVLTIGLVSLTSHFSTNIIRDLVIDSGIRNVNIRANFLGNWFEEQKKDIQVYANTQLLKKGTWEEKKEYLQQELAARAEEYFFFFIADSKGDYSTTQQDNAGNVSDRNYFSKVMQGETVISEPVISKSTGEPIMVVATPLKDGENQVIGLLGAVVQLERLTSQISNLKIEGYDHFSFMVDNQGMIIAHPEKELIMKDSSFSGERWELEAADKIIDKDNGVIRQRINKDLSYIFYHQIPGTRGLKLITRVPEEQLVVPLKAAVNKLLLSGLIAVVLAVGAGMLISREISRPIIKLKDLFTRGAQGDLSVRAELDRKDEIGEAAVSFNQMMEKINDLKYNDPVTGLPNMIYFKEKLEADLKELIWGEERIVLFAIGIDNLKDINDGFGYLVGDELLKVVAREIKNYFDREKVVCRISDEFFVYVVGERSKEEIFNLGKDLLDKINSSYQVKGEEIYLTTSIGIAIYPDDSETEEGLIKNASLAMHLAKDERDNKIKCYSINIEDRISRRMSLESKLVEALHQEQFLLYYQPLITTETKKVEGLEALIRWEHPTEGMISPGKFISLAERNGMIIEIGNWVLKEACSQLKEWHQRGYDNIYVSVNIAPQQFQSSTFIPAVKKALAETKLPPKYLELEITERATIENIDYTIESLEKLRELGVKISIDDFGTGYSSLSYLKEFAIHTLKIDRSFISELLIDDKNTAIAETIITMGHNLNLKVLAEGVETKEQINFLRKRNCDVLQGFFFSKPLPEEEVVDLLGSKDY